MMLKPPPCALVSVFIRHPPLYPIHPTQGGEVVLAPGLDEVVALNATTGARVWSVPAEDGPWVTSFTSSASYSHDGALAFVGCGWDSALNNDCEVLTAIDLTSGEVAWRFAPNGTTAVNHHTLIGPNQLWHPAGWSSPAILAVTCGL
mmetsp:Transcript_34570/g.80104  ORF Transcript_34570/g.80104 Transcript_34570/m.80104 type:complete len:147 (-) Transcript_34570:1169-1609(-)